MLTYPRRLCRRIKWAWQRVWRGWDDTTVWGIDYWLIETIPPMLEQLRKHKSYPGVLITEEIEKLPQAEIDAICEKEWNVILDTIIAGFRAAGKIADGDSPIWDEYWDAYDRVPGDALNWNSPEHQETRKRLRKELNFDARLKEEEDAQYKIFDAGMEAFKKYFFFLWY